MRGQFHRWASSTRIRGGVAALHLTKELSMILIIVTFGVSGLFVVLVLLGQVLPARALVRNPDKAGAMTAAPCIEIVQADLLVPGTLTAALDGIDTVVLISSADDRMVEAQCNLIDAAVASGVNHIVKVSG